MWRKQKCLGMHRGIFLVLLVHNNHFISECEINYRNIALIKQIVTCINKDSMIKVEMKIVNKEN